MRPARTIVLPVVTVLALSGCIGPFDDAADPPPSSSTASSSATPSPTRTTDFGRAERELSDAEAKRALPKEPAGAKPNKSPQGSNRRTDPEVCIDLLRLGWQGRNTKATRTGYAQSDYFTGSDTDDYEGYTVSIASHSSPVSPNLLGRAGDAIGQCETFSFTGMSAGNSFDDRYLAEGLPVRNIGEQTFAVHLTGFANVEGKSHRLYIDQLDFRVGHNLVSVRSATYRESTSTAALEKKAQEILEHLEK